ncbi:MAG: hypothetical protein JRI25_15105 [Deltaproteobacteria bacterium]|nr:hypothetical protein [Deltaproteobacteria bacterium]MBW2255910.1 hypothetical protein [Deltaproteobacteria bacterium]
MRRHLGVCLFGWMVLTIGIACGGGETVSVDVDPVVVEPPAVEVPEVAEDSILTAGVMWGSHLCTEKAGDNCVDPTTTFAHDTPMIYFVHQTKDLPEKAQTYNIRWIAVDVGDAAPAGTVVFDLNEVVTEGMLLKIATHYTISSQASKPTAGWPPGSYKVAITLDGAPVTEAAYTIE